MPKGYGPVRGGATYRQSAQVREYVRKRDGYRCRLCGCGVGQVCNLHYASVGQLDVAHIRPWEQSHDSTLANLRVLCHPCNLREARGTAGETVFAGGEG